MSNATGFTSSKIKGTPFRSVSGSSLDPLQQQIHGQLGQGLGQYVSGLTGKVGGLATGASDEDWQKLEAPALRQFGATQGNLASRFSGMGGSGSRNSSGFQNTMGEAGASLAEQLQSQRMGYQTQAQQQMMQMINMLLGRDTLNQGFVPEKENFLKQLTLAGVGAGGKAAGAYLGRPG